MERNLDLQLIAKPNPGALTQPHLDATTRLIYKDHSESTPVSTSLAWGDGLPVSCRVFRTKPPFFAGSGANLVVIRP